MKTLVCGGRYFDDTAALDAELDRIHAENPITLLIHGAARGADNMAAFWAANKGVPRKAFPADWKSHGRAAGPIRNKQMLVEGAPDLVVAFKGGRGTENMIGLAQAAGVTVRRVE